jgi:hypothetical protein
VVTAALVAANTGDPSWLADQARSIAGQDAIDRFTASLAAFAFVSGLLLALSLLEPRTDVVVEEVVADQSVAPRRTVLDNETTTLQDREPVDTR